MSEAQFPARTAGDLTLPNGETVWLCTLNTLLTDEADTEARWHAQKKGRRYLKGGPDYPELLAQVKAMSAEGQAAYLAQQEYWTIRRETADRYPDPPRPEQGDSTPEAFTKAVIVWEADCKKASEKRDKAEQTRYEAEVKKAAALSSAVRIERCCTAYFTSEWGQAFMKRREMEILYRAVRVADDHTRRYFASPESYEDSDDTLQEALREFYFKTLDTLKPEDVPTLPAAS